MSFLPMGHSFHFSFFFISNTWRWLPASSDNSAKVTGRVTYANEHTATLNVTRMKTRLLFRNTVVDGFLLSSRLHDSNQYIMDYFNRLKVNRFYHRFDILRSCEYLMCLRATRHSIIKLREKMKMDLVRIYNC